MTEAPARRPLAAALTTDESRELAERHGLRSLNQRPPLGRYIADVWRRRSFLWTLSSAESYAKNEANHLGQVWAILNPAVLIGSYFLIFGLLLSTRGGVDNFIAFLSIGVVMFGFTSSVITRGAKAITGRLGIVRALHFPRAILPMSVALTEFLATVPAFGLLFALMLLTGERPDWEWLLFPVAVIIQGVTLLGFAFIAARLVNASQDMANLIPVVVRLLRYVSGVFFPVAHYVAGAPPVIQAVLTLQPFALMLTIVRQSLLGSEPVVLSDWLIMTGWAVVIAGVGLIYFWRAETRYGRG
ncbi:phosphate ABC transporter permease [Janibacter sp. Soil728]|uniref:ABC transporter permease n=1 Tax=Janibacter sp. Soil728 TaxID=1736393 RepID=UPI0007018B50|nr:ABC transporter permease [Janibacter sp. Soil728]KRE35392.1 phosphate ABC transporter permease [Janibacter sp. Soil728]